VEAGIEAFTIGHDLVVFGAATLPVGFLCCFWFRVSFGNPWFCCISSMRIGELEVVFCDAGYLGRSDHSPSEFDWASALSEVDFLWGGLWKQPCEIFDSTVGLVVFVALDG